MEELKRDFLRFYSRFDSRLARCKKPLDVSFKENGMVQISVVYHKRHYSAIYKTTE